MARLAKLLFITIMFLSSSFISNNLFVKEVRAETCFGFGKYAVGTLNGDKIKWECKSAKIEGADAKTEKVTNYYEAFAATLAAVSLGTAAIMIAYAGILYTTSGGDPKLAKQAKMQLIAAGIGVFIAMSSFVIMGLMDVFLK